MADIIQSGQEVRGDQPALSSTSWTSGTTVNTANTISVTGYNTVSVAMHNTTTMTGGVLTFEVSPDNTNWFPIAMARIDSYTVETTYTLSTVADRAWSTSVDGFTNFRVRLSTVITGSGTATVFVTAQTFAIEPIVAVGQLTAANLLGTMSQGGTWTVQPGNTQNTTAWLVGDVPLTSGGLTIKHLISAATTNATNVKASAGQLYGWYIQNANAAARYVKLHNTAGTPTAGSGVVMTIGVPGASAANVFSPIGIAFGTGIGFTTTTGITDADAVAVTASDLNINLFYN